MTDPNELWHTGSSSDAKSLRKALGCSPTGVAIVAAMSPEGRPVGLTINSFASVSIDPPLMLWSLLARSPSLGIFENCARFGLSILADDQEELCLRFARPDIPDKFDGVSWSRGQSGVPLIDGAIAQFECGNEGRMEGGDHIVFLGVIEKFRWRDGFPLVFHRAGLTRLSLLEAA